ncbi:MAG: hypothetical protein Q9157_002184 [Trypethelium eluteriae]
MSDAFKNIQFKIASHSTSPTAWLAETLVDAQRSNSVRSSQIVFVLARLRDREWLYVGEDEKKSLPSIAIAIPKSLSDPSRVLYCVRMPTIAFFGVTYLSKKINLKNRVNTQLQKSRISTTKHYDVLPEEPEVQQAKPVYMLRPLKGEIKTVEIKGSTKRPRRLA